jgi:predicted RNase H-like nuclease (RuvC/YqgF family)
MSTEITKNTTYKYSCECCDFNTSKKTDYARHLATAKHKFFVLATIGNTKNDKNTIQYCCKMCDKEFADRTGLWRHNKKCNKNEQLMEEYHKKIDKLTDVVLDVVSKNSELTKQIIELSKSGGTNHSHNTSHNNSHNKTFNLQVFLNEECKNAINIRDFVESIQVQLSDLENTGQVGYVEGISQIFIDNLGKINKHDRPIHCSDYKREVLYIKNENKWIKETDDKSTIKNAIKQVANKNIKQIKQWQEKYPDFNNPKSKINDKYMQIVYNSMSGSTEEEQKTNMNKIIRNVAKEVIIEK